MLDYDKFSSYDGRVQESTYQPTNWQDFANRQNTGTSAITQLENQIGQTSTMRTDDAISSIQKKYLKGELFTQQEYQNLQSVYDSSNYETQRRLEPVMDFASENTLSEQQQIGGLTPSGSDSITNFGSSNSEGLKIEPKTKDLGGAKKSKEITNSLTSIILPNIQKTIRGEIKKNLGNGGGVRTILQILEECD